MTLWDTHCHLADCRFAPDLDAVCLRARDAGVEAIVVIAADPEAWGATAALAGPGRARGGPELWVAHGLHPNEAHRSTPALWSDLERRLRVDRAVALGEIGLDYHHGFAEPADQRAALERQLRLAADLDLPIVLHEREAADDLVAVLRAAGLPRRGGVWHCFSGGPALASEALDLGLHLGFGGLVTFPRGTEPIRATAVDCPAERVLLETDAPYLAPVPHRGRRNEPAWVSSVLAFLAELRGEAPEELAAATSANARRLFVPCVPGTVSADAGEDSAHGAPMRS